MSLAAVKRAVDRVLAAVLAGLLTALVGCVVWQVVTRFVVGRPSSVTEEAARFLLIWLGLLGAGYAAGQRLHVGFDLLARRWSGAAPLLGRLALTASALTSLAILGIGGSYLVVVSLELGQTSAALGWKLGYVYLALPVSGILLAFYVVAAAGEDEERGAAP